MLGLLNSEANWADDVANFFSFRTASCKTFAWVMRGATYYASSSFRSMLATD